MMLERFEIEVKNLLETKELVGESGLRCHLVNKLLDSAKIYRLFKDILTELDRESDYHSMEPEGIFGPKRESFCQTILQYIRIGRISNDLRLLPKLSSYNFTTVAEILSTPERWYRGSYCPGFIGFNTTQIDESSCCCILGALHILTRNQHPSEFSERKIKIQAAIKKYAESHPQFRQNENEYDSLPYGIATFNDQPETTFEDIQAVLAIAGV